MHDDLAVGVSLEDSGLLELLPERAVVVDLAVDRQDDLAIVGDQRLRTGVCGKPSESATISRWHSLTTLNRTGEAPSMAGHVRAEGASNGCTAGVWTPIATR